MPHPSLRIFEWCDRGLQGNPCNENRDPAMRTGVPCNENRFFPVGIDSQGVPCELYRVWVCSVGIITNGKLILQGLHVEKYLQCELHLKGTGGFAF